MDAAVRTLVLRPSWFRYSWLEDEGPGEVPAGKHQGQEFQRQQKEAEEHPVQSS